MVRMWRYKTKKIIFLKVKLVIKVQSFYRLNNIFCKNMLKYKINNSFFNPLLYILVYSTGHQAVEWPRCQQATLDSISGAALLRSLDLISLK